MAHFNLASGHGAGDSGATLGTRKEKDDNLRLALAVEAELLKRGHAVSQYRRDDSINCSWKECRAWLEANPADFSVVFHRNAYNNAANGVEVWSFDADTFSCEVAKIMSIGLAKTAGFYNRGRKGNGAAWLSSNVRCIQLETGFVDTDNDNIKFDTFFDDIVVIICDILEQYFGKVEKKEPQNETTSTEQGQTESFESSEGNLTDEDKNELESEIEPLEEDKSKKVVEILKLIVALIKKILEFFKKERE